MKKSFKAGFTIIELIVVIAIIGVLASIVMVNVTGYINKSKDASIKANLGQIPRAVAVWVEEHDGYPSDATVFSSFQDSAINPYHSGTGENWYFCEKLSSDSTKAWCVDKNDSKEIDWSACEPYLSGCP